MEITSESRNNNDYALKLFFIREGLNKSILVFSDHENQKCDFCFSSFSMA